MPRVSRNQVEKSGGKPSTHKPLVTNCSRRRRGKDFNNVCSRKLSTLASSLEIEIAIRVLGNVTELAVCLHFTHCLHYVQGWPKHSLGS
jgi:hypothetical protein